MRAESWRSAPPTASGAPEGRPRQHPPLACACVPEAIREIRAGRCVILVDDERGEEGGVLCIAADAVTPQAINVMARDARGLICLALDESRFEQLGLRLMVPETRNGCRRSTAFGVSIEARRGVTTGISAFDRSHTVRTAIADDASPDDLARPGHVFPLLARPRGVLERPGHTEGSVDLTRLAGRRPGAVICTILKSDGTLARGPELPDFGRRHGMAIVSISHLVRHRVSSEKLVHRVAEAEMPTRHGDLRAAVYRDGIDGGEHVALVRGRIREDEPLLVGIHRECVVGDAFGSKRCRCGDRLQAALHRIGSAGSGVLLYLRRKDRGRRLVDQIRTYALEDAREPSGRGLEDERDRERDLGIAAGMLRSLGVRRLRLLSDDPSEPKRIADHGLEICETLPLAIAPEERSLPSPLRGRQPLERALDLAVGDTAGL